MGTLFISGHTTPSPDGLAVILADDEKDMILGEMPGMLQAVADNQGAGARGSCSAVAAAWSAISSRRLVGHAHIP